MGKVNKIDVAHQIAGSWDLSLGHAWDIVNHRFEQHLQGFRYQDMTWVELCTMDAQEAYAYG